MQQDAEEFYSTLIMMINRGLETSGSAGVAARDSFLNLKMEETLSCSETDAEPRVVRTETVNRLVCNIQGGPGSSTAINHLHDGLKLGLEGTVEKNSEVLGRNALWNKHQRISKLPRFLCVQFMRFFWKETPESRDHTGVKCKILRPVTFTEVSFRFVLYYLSFLYFVTFTLHVIMLQTFDVFDFCTAGLQERLKLNRLRKDRKEEASLEVKRRKLAESPGKPESEPMEVVADPAVDAMLEVATAADVPPVPPSDSSVLQTSDADYEARLSGSLAAEASGAPIPHDEISTPVSEHFGAGLPNDFVGEYELMGVVTHKGRSADSGHYIGWVRQTPASDYWWRYDDDIVTEVTTAEILDLKGGGDWHTAYLNFYRYKGEE
jgi:ubiquitin carboxyl-terminal hydrolase 14